MATRKKKARRPARRKTARKARRRVKRKQPEALRLRATAPSFTVNDLQKSIAWYTDVLGFTVKERWEREGRLMGVEIVAGTVTFGLSQDDWKKGRDRRKGEGCSVYCTTVQDVDEMAARIKARGGALLKEPRDQPWGTRDFAVADPDGFKITISRA